MEGFYALLQACRIAGFVTSISARREARNCAQTAFPGSGRSSLPLREGNCVAAVQSPRPSQQDHQAFDLPASQNAKACLEIHPSSLGSLSAAPLSTLQIGRAHV